MKRSLIIIFLVTYILSVSGMTMNMHYCGGELSSVNLGWFTSGQDVKCGCGKKEMSSNCCKDKKLSLKLKDAHKKPVQLFDFTKRCFQKPVAIWYTPLCYSLQTYTQLNKLFFFHDPPEPIARKILLFVCILRI